MTVLADEAYQYAIAEVTKAYKDTPEDEKLLDIVLASFKKRFENPPINDFEMILQKNFTVEEIICALFKPTDEQIRWVNESVMNCDPLSTSI